MEDTRVESTMVSLGHSRDFKVLVMLGCDIPIVKPSWAVPFSGVRLMLAFVCKLHEGAPTVQAVPPLAPQHTVRTGATYDKCPPLARVTYGKDSCHTDFRTPTKALNGEGLPGY